MRRLKRLIKTFDFNEDNRGRITLNTGVRLDPQRHHLVLSGPPFDDTPGSPVIAKTWVTNPSTVKQWLGFEAVITHVTEGGSDPSGKPIQVELTGAGYRLSDGTDEFWWNGSTWVVNTTDFNTEGEVATNISTFPIASQQLQVVINLTTTNADFSPTLRKIKVLWASDIEFMEDYVYRMIVRDLRTKIRPISDYVVAPGVATTTLDLANDFPLETPYNIVGIDSVYDRTLDPKSLTDLFQSFDTGTKVITLNATLPASSMARIRLIYEPEVAVTTSQDFSEIAKVPAVVCDDVNLVDASPVGGFDSVVNKSDFSAVKVQAPIQGDIEVILHGLTDKGVDQKRLADEIHRYFEQNGTVRSPGLDEEFTLWLIDEYDMRTPPGSADMHTGRARFRVRDVVFFVRDSEDSFAIKRFLATGTEDFILSE